MFEKALVDGKVLYFPHTPPRTVYDKPNNKRRIKDPKPNTEPLYASVYYYWWAFLRLNSNYIECCERGGMGPNAQLYADFGDVRDDSRPTDDGDHFKAWWIERGAILFAEPDVTVEVEEMPASQSATVSDNYLFLKVPLLGAPKALARQIDKIIQAEYKKRNKIFSHAMYRAAGQHQLQSLEHSLRIKEAEIKLRKDNPMRKPTNAELVAEARIRVFDKPDYHYGSDPKAAIRTKGSRYLREANTLIENVLLGSFPDFGKKTGNRGAKSWLPKANNPHVIACRKRLLGIDLKRKKTM